MAETTPKKVIPLHVIPDVGSRTVSIEGRNYLLMNDAMYTFYQRSMGELTPFFLALRDDRKILGCRCTKCGIVRVPPFMQRCPDCDFAPTELVEVEDVGTMLSTPPITYFANALFQEQVPFGRGRVVLRGADTALSVNFYTTRGILVPGIVKKGAEVKIVFRDERHGAITDIFAISTAELTPEQIRRQGLLDSELNWAAAIEPAIPEAAPSVLAAHHEALAEIKSVAGEMQGSERARKDIADWRRTIHVKSAGGQLTLRIDNGDLIVSEGISGTPDFVMVCPDLRTLAGGLAYRGSLTQAIMEKRLWISKNPEFTTIFKLERMARSLARSKKV